MCNHIYGLLNTTKNYEIYTNKDIKEGAWKNDVVFKFCPFCGVQINEFAKRNGEILAEIINKISEVKNG